MRAQPARDGLAGNGTGAVWEGFTMPSAVVADSGLRSCLSAILIPRTFVRLYRQPAPVLPTSRLSDFQACLFPGYADLEVTSLFTAPSLDPVGRAFAAAYNLTWTRGSGGVPESAYGWLWYYGPDPTGTLIGGAQFTVPQPINSAGNSIVFSFIAYQLRG